MELVLDGRVPSHPGQCSPAAAAPAVTAFPQLPLETLAVSARHPPSLGFSLNSLCLPAPLSRARLEKPQRWMGCPILSLTSCSERWENAMATGRQEHPPAQHSMARRSELPAECVASPLPPGGPAAVPVAPLQHTPRSRSLLPREGEPMERRILQLPTGMH